MSTGFDKIQYLFMIKNLENRSRRKLAQLIRAFAKNLQQTFFKDDMLKSFALKSGIRQRLFLLIRGKKATEME